jgi:hypothetical protein
VLGFAGCDYTPPEPPKSSLTFRARVPTALTVEPPGVKFAWSRPSGGIEETAEVSEFEADDANDVNVYEHEIPILVGDKKLEEGGWRGRCEMTVRADGQVADATSGDCPFELTVMVQDYVLRSKRREARWRLRSGRVQGAELDDGGGLHPARGGGRARSNRCPTRS